MTSSETSQPMFMLDEEHFTVTDEGHRLVGCEKPHRVLKNDRTVVVRRIDSDVVQAVSDAFDRIDAGSIMRPGDPVAVKINLGGGIHHILTTYSDPVICEAILLKIRQLGGKPFVCEADMRAHIMNDRMLRVRGYEDMLRRNDVEFVNLSRGRTVEMTCLGLDIPLVLPEILLMPDLKIVSFAPPKHHWECGVTGVQKNMYGAIAEFRKSIYHRKFDRIDKAVAAAARLMTPDIGILATFDIGTKLGPHFCAPVPFNRLVAGRDMLRVDRAACDILGFPWEHVEYARINAQGETVDYDLDPDSDWPDPELLETIRRNAITPPCVGFWKRLLFPQYFVPHCVQISAYPPLEFVATWLNRVFFGARNVSR